MALLPITGEGETVSINLSAASVDIIPLVMPDLTTEKTEGVTILV